MFFFKDINLNHSYKASDILRAGDLFKTPLSETTIRRRIVVECQQLESGVQPS